MLSSRQLIEAGRQLEAPFELELQRGSETKPARCVELLRLVPQQRVVGKVLIAGQAYLAKIFLGAGAEKYCQREKKGIKALVAAGVQTVTLVDQLQLTDQGAEVLLLEYLPAVMRLSELVETRPAAAEQWLEQAVKVMAQLHVAGLQHKDCHLGNFLVNEQGMYLIDGDAVVESRPSDKAQALQNLALFFVQLPLKFLPRLQSLFAIYCQILGWDSGARQAQLDRQIEQQRAGRQRRFLKKIYRDCTQFQVEQSSTRYLVMDRQEAPGELGKLVTDLDQHIASGELLKDGNSATVAKVTIGNKCFAVKRYNMKSVTHWLKRCWRPSRAWLSWRNAQLLTFYGVGTPKPLAMVEERFAGLRRRAYFITEYSAAEDALAFVEKAADDASRLSWLAEQFARLFRTMALLKISHGDFKGTNFLVENDRLSVIDLDSMQLHRSVSVLNSALTKDVQRFMKNWPEKNGLHSIMSKAVADLP